MTKGFYAILKERVLNGAYNESVLTPRNYRLVPVRYRSRAIGGSEDAEIRVEANGEDLWNSLNWLGCGVVIYNQFDTPVWSGMIDSATVKVGKRSRGNSLDKVFNRVKTTYTTTDVDGIPSRGDTAWTEDADSIDRFGTREKRYNIGESDATMAESVRDEILRRVSKPIARRRRSTGNDDYATLHCRGYWDVFKNKYYTRTDGKDEYIESGDSEQMLNWGLTSTLLSFDSQTITYGKPITGATNATPIVITCTGHGYINGDIVTIKDVVGNTAANGEYKVASSTTNTFALTDKITSANIAGNGAYTSGGVIMSTSLDGPFSPLGEGDLVVVTGSASNNSTFTLSRSAGNNGHSIDVTATLTTEASGASVTIKNYVQQLAQSFTPTSSWRAVEVAARLKKVGSPTFSIVIELRSNNAGVPSATILASVTISYTVIGTTMQWEKATLSPSVALTSGTTYWVLVRTSAGAVDPDDGFVVALDSALGYSTGALKVLTPASAWANRPTDADMPFRVLDRVDTADQIEAIFLQAGTIFTAFDATIASGLTSNQYRSGENTAAEEISDLLDAGNSSGTRLIAGVTMDRAVFLANQTTTTGNEIYDRDGMLFHPNNTPFPPGVLPVAQWIRELGVPLNLDFMVDIAAQFVEGAEYDCESGDLNWWGQDDDAPYKLLGITQG